MTEIKGLRQLLAGKLMEMSGLLSFRIFITLVAIEVVYPAAKDFSLGFRQGVMDVVGG